jgi:MinD superfamily P-loop ATPase
MPRQLKQLTVVSGKGGTGKTTVLASLAALAPNAVLADCDVDAANLHLLLDPQVQTQGEFRGAKVAVRDESRCDRTGECARRCRFDAITPDRVDVHACEGCGLCVLACPRGALTLEPIVNGLFYCSETQYGPMAHARLFPAGESSGRLVTKVRQLAEDLALQSGRQLILIDGPPGIGCTAVASLAEVDLALVVTEPTLSGIHDMERVVGLTEHFGAPVAVAINKADLNESNAARIRTFCDAHRIPVVAELPFDDVVPRSIAARKPLVEYDDGPAARGVRELWQRVEVMLGANGHGRPEAGP